MSVPADVARFVAEHPELIETAVDVIRAMLEGREKDRIAGMVRLRRRVDAERLRAAAVAAADKTSRGSSNAERRVHTPEVAGASPAPAPKRRAVRLKIDGFAPGDVGDSGGFRA